MKVLVLAANPIDQDHLRVAAEARDIRARTRRVHGGALAIVHVGSVRPMDLIDLLQDEEPDILHYSGHGSEQGEIVLEDDQGRGTAVRGKHFAELFKVLKKKPRCVFLNACYSEQQAKALSKYVPYVVGMESLISDDAAIAFSMRFYEQLARGDTLETAFATGCLQLKMLFHFQDDALPKLIRSKRVDEQLGTVPDICAKFRVNRNGKPLQQGHEYKIMLTVRHIPDEVVSIVVNLNDESFQCDDRFFELKPLDGEATEEISTYGNVEIRVTLWYSDRGENMRSTLAAALEHWYGAQSKGEIGKAIGLIRES